MDVHVPQAITDQLRRRGIDVLTAIEDSSAELADEALLEHASSLGRVLFTQDIRFKALAEDWFRELSQQVVKFFNNSHLVEEHS
jgi:predicted nuclease of predicted toxin-antitoxin system